MEEIPFNAPPQLVRQIKKSKEFKQFSGIYRGIIDKVSDEYKQGYVRVRIPNIHNESLTSDQLPLGYVSQPFGGGDNYGTLIIPPINSTVFVIFENGEPSKPIIVGTWYGEKFDGDEVIDTEVPKSTKNCFIRHDQKELVNDEKASIELEQKTSIKDPYDSKDSINKEDREEPRNFIFKSPKGHVIELDDTGFSDGGEEDEDRPHNEGIRITSRKGQIISVIDQPEKECILIKTFDSVDEEGNATPGSYIQIDGKNKNINVYAEDRLQEEINGVSIKHVCKDEVKTIENDKILTVKQDKTDAISNNWTVAVGNNINITCLGECNISSVGNLVINAESNVILSCAQGVTASVTGDMTSSVQGNMISTVQGSTTLDCTSEVTIKGSSINLNP